MFFRGKKKKKIDHHVPPPDDAGWDAFAFAVASGAGIIAVTVLEIEVFPALLIGEATSVALLRAQQRHEEKEKKLHEWHMSLLGAKVDRIVDDLLGKPVASLTDKDRIQLALLSDWGMISDDREARMPPKLKAEVLLTQLTLSAEQQGISILKLAEKFSFPGMAPGKLATEGGIKALQTDRQRMKDMLLQRKDPSWLGGVGERFGKSVVGKLVQKVGKDVRAVRSAAGLAFELPSLKKIWNILSAKGPANSAEEFLDRMAGNLQSTYDSGFSRLRCATRRTLRQAGIPHESVLVAKPEGGKRHIVRRKPKL
ncbi:MAG: hypothetical protein ACAH83_11620 [Alphaproteobacteria bacterium]